MSNWKKSMAMIVMLFFVMYAVLPQAILARSENVKESVNQGFLESLNNSTVILHTNDMHGRVLYGQNKSLGITAVVALKIKLEQAGAQVITLDAGDTFRGTTITNNDQGATMVQLMNIIGYDAMVCGNHDYEYGYEHLVELKKEASFSILGANVIVRNTNQNLLASHIILERNGIKYGIFGLVTEATMLLNQEEHVDGILLMDPIECAKIEVSYLKAAGADIIVALTHIGMKAKDEINTMDLLKEVEGIDIVIDGHSHSTLAECQAANPQPKVTFTSTGSYLNSIGIVVIQQDGTRTPYNLTEKELNALGIDPRNEAFGIEDPRITNVQQLLAKRVLSLPTSYQVRIGPTTMFLSFLAPNEELSSPAMTQAITEGDILLPKLSFKQK